MNNKKFLYFILFFSFVLILILFIYKHNTFNIKNINASNFNNIITKYNSIIITYGEITNNDEIRLKKYYKDYSMKFFHYDDSLDSLNSLLKADNNITDGNYYILFLNSEYKDYISSSKSDDEIKEFIEKYLFNKIPENETYYLVLPDSDSYIKKVNSKDYVVAVFGNDNCTYCDLYLPVINEIVNKYNIPIYYFNRNQYDVNEYNKIMALDFEIPAKCTTTGVSTTMTKGFPKPMTLITKNKKLVDCIRGYVSEDEVLEVLNKYNLIKE